MNLPKPPRFTWHSSSAYEEWARRQLDFDTEYLGEGEFGPRVLLKWREKMSDGITDMHREGEEKFSDRLHRRAREKDFDLFSAAQGANGAQIAGGHYKSKAVQPWDYIASNNIGYLAGNAIKYLSRYKDKGGADDIRKAIHYCYKLLEVEYPEK